MKSKSKHEKPAAARAYNSTLRAEQAEATRQMLLNTVREMVSRNEEVGYTAIARESNVSVPTVYRHFPTMSDLFEAIYRDEERRAGESDDLNALLDPSAMHRAVNKFFARFDDPDDVYARSTRLGSAWEFSRAVTVPRRRALMERYVDHHAPDLDEPTRTCMVDLLIVLLSASTAEAMRGYLNRSGAETAQRVRFAFDALIAHALRARAPSARAKPTTPTRSAPKRPARS